MTAWPSTSMILLGHEPVRLAVHRFGRGLARRVDEAEHALGVAVVPVAQVVDAVLGLDFDVHRVRAGELLGRDGDAVVAIHVGRHGIPPIVPGESSWRG